MNLMLEVKALIVMTKRFSSNNYFRMGMLSQTGNPKEGFHLIISKQKGFCQNNSCHACVAAILRKPHRKSLNILPIAEQKSLEIGRTQIALHQSIFPIIFVNIG